MKNPEVLTGGRNARQDVRNNKLKNQFVKRSNVMKYNRFIQIAATIFVALTIVVSGAFAQNAVLSGTSVANAGTIIIKGALSGTITTLGGTVEFGAAGAQNIPAGYTFLNLTASGGTGDKTLLGATAVSGTLTVNNPSFKLLLNGQTLTYSGTGTLAQTAGTFDFTSGTVNYSLNGIQTIFGTTYANLTTSGVSVTARTKTAGGNVTVTGTLTNGTLTTLDFAGNAFVGTGVTFANSATLKSSSTVSVTPAVAIGGTFEYAGTQTVAPASYTDLTFSGAGAKTFTSGATYSIAGTYIPGGGANDYTGSTINYNGAGPLQAIADVSYANLTFSSGTKAWTLGADRTITGNLTLNAGTATTVGGAHDLYVTGDISLASNLTKSTNAVVFANAGSTVTGALNDIIGTVTRTHAFVGGTAYQFNNQDTKVALSVSPGAQSFSMTVTPNTAPFGNSPGHSVQRKFVPTFTSLGGGTADVQLAYLSGELGGATEGKLKEFNNGISSTHKMVGGAYVRQAVGVSFGYVTLPTITTAFASTQELALDDRYSQFITIASTEWSIGSTWDAGSPPTATDDAEINTTGVTLDAIGHVNNLVINTGKDLTLGTATSALTVDGGLTNNGGLTLVGSSTLVVTGTFNNLGTATLTNAGTITVQ
jgi:fibronectin-binding autotransporter adhesin